VGLMICRPPQTVIPEILQSDGGEFTARCITQQFTVQGCPRHPQSQGSIERGNGPFKEALDVWISQNVEQCWPEVGAYVVNRQFNGRPSWQIGGKSPYLIKHAQRDITTDDIKILVRQADDVFEQSE
jgi:hypothetical protein